MGQAELIMTLVITLVLTSLIVMGANWITKNREKHPELYKRKRIIGSIIYILLNLGDLL
jgi:hypothetical protein